MASPIISASQFQTEIADLGINHALILHPTADIVWQAGDADINCNWLGGHASVLAMDWYGNQTLHRTPLTNITLNGTAVASVQNVDNFSFA